MKKKYITREQDSKCVLYIDGGNNVSQLVKMSIDWAVKVMEINVIARNFRQC